MRFFREFPLVLGSLLSFGVAPALTLLLVLPFRGRNFQGQSEFASFYLLVVAFYLLIALFTFMVSIKHVVIPLYQRNKIVSIEFGQMKRSDYFINWLTYEIYSVGFSLPLACLIAFFPSVGIVRYVWQLVASYFAYNLVVNKWIEETMSHNQPADKNPIPTV